MTDVIVRPEGPLARGTDRRATIRTVPGGSGANQAAWFAHFGVPTRFAGRVGRADHAWQSALLERAGVEPILSADDDLPTGTVVTLVSPDGERSFFTERGANCRLAGADVPPSLLDGVALLHLSGYVLFEAGARQAVLELLAAAMSRGIPVTIDPGSESFLREVGADRFLAWTAGAQICFPNAAEAAALAGTDQPAAQLDRLGRHYPLVVVKHGVDGASAAAGTERWSIPAPTAAAVDSSGAGDAFLAGFLAARLAGEGVEPCLAAGIGAAALAITQFGARPPSAGAAERLPPAGESAL